MSNEGKIELPESNVHTTPQLDEATAFGKQELMCQLIRFRLISEATSGQFQTITICISPMTPLFITVEP